MSEKDEAYRRFLRENHLSPSAAMRETFTAGWTAALAAVLKSQEKMVTLEQFIKERHNSERDSE